MLRWLVGFLRQKSGVRAPNPPPRSAPPALASRQPASEPDPIDRGHAEAGETSAAEPEGPDPSNFLVQLLAGEPTSSLEELPPDDRLFVSAILKRVRENRLEVPLLPNAALRISRLVSEPDSEISEFVEVLQADAALSVEILRIANSVYYGFVHETRSVREAVVRIGLNRVWGLIVNTHLYGKILHAGTCQREAGWLSELSLKLAHAAESLAPYLGLASDDAFTLGMLWHVEHLIVLSALPELSKEHRRKIQPSYRGLQHAFARFGPSVRELAAKRWGLEHLLLPGPGRIGIVLTFLQLRDALIAAWTGAELPKQVEGVPAEALDRVIRGLQRSRVAPVESAPAGLPLPEVALSV